MIEKTTDLCWRILNPKRNFKGSFCAFFLVIFVYNINALSAIVNILVTGYAYTNLTISPGP